MKIQTQHRIDSLLRDAVLSQFDFEPEVLSTGIGVAAEEGVVTLTGFVNTYAQRVAAEKAAKRVYGVKAVANGLQVKVVYERADPDLAKDVLRALETHLDVPEDRIKVTVQDGWVTLEGSVALDSQKEAASSAAQHLRGVRGVTNLIELTPGVSPTEVKTQIEEALRRNARVDARRIIVEAQGSTVHLGGHAGSWAEKEEAERTAWAVPGIAKVENYILVVS